MKREAEKFYQWTKLLTLQACPANAFIAGFILAPRSAARHPQGLQSRGELSTWTMVLFSPTRCKDASWEE